LSVLLREQVQAARRSLALPGTLTDARLHAARKRLKSARATLRLLRPVIGESAFTRANRALRDVAAPLGAARDTTVLLHALAALRARRERTVPGTRALRAALKQRRGALSAALRTDGRQRRDALARLTRVAQQAQRWRPSDARAFAGLTATYRQGRRCYAAVCRDASDPALHEWRKQAKYLANELRVLRGCAPRRVDPWRRRAERIAEALGADHDLALLGREVQRSDMPDGARGRLLRRLERARSRLQARAHASGERLYRFKSARFIARLQRPR
jgi:CHAD domain-containing protein